MKIEMLASDRVCVGKVEYIVEDDAFHFAPKPGGGYASLTVNELQLEIDRQGVLLYPWGLCPQQGWKAELVTAPPAKRRKLRALLKMPIMVGMGYGVNEPRWPTYVNPEAGWLCMGNPRLPDAKGIAIEFASGCIAVLQKDEIKALWLYSENLPSLPKGERKSWWQGLIGR